jgi:hypothetical protein
MPITFASAAGKQQHMDDEDDETMHILPGTSKAEESTGGLIVFKKTVRKEGEEVAPRTSMLGLDVLAEQKRRDGESWNVPI